MKSNIVIKSFTQEYADHVIDLLSIGFGKYMSKEYLNSFKHIHFQNPVQNFKPLGIIAISEGKVIGYRGFVESLWKYNEIQIKTLTPTGAVVHPSYRDQGIFVEMNNLSFDLYQDDYDYFLNTSSNKLSAPRYLKLHWQVLGEKDNLYRRILFKKGIRKLDMYFSESVPFEVIMTINKNSYYKKDKIKLNFESEEYVKWLYTSHNYHFCIFADGYKSLAYVCFTLHHGRCEIIDYDNTTELCLLNKMIHIIAVKYNCRNFTAFTAKNNSSLYKSFLRAGFFSTNYRPVRRLLRKEMMPFLIRPLCKNYDEKKFAEKSNYVNNIDNWIILRICNH